MEEKYKSINLKEEEEKNQSESKYLNCNYYCPTPKTNEKTIVKPDFSPFLIQETQFGFKTNGSYKKQKKKFPGLPLNLLIKHIQFLPK